MINWIYLCSPFWSKIIEKFGIFVCFDRTLWTFQFLLNLISATDASSRHQNAKLSPPLSIIYHWIYLVSFFDFQVNRWIHINPVIVAHITTLHIQTGIIPARSFLLKARIYTARFLGRLIVLSSWLFIVLRISNRIFLHHGKFVARSILIRNVQQAYQFHAVCHKKEKENANYYVDGKSYCWRIEHPK